MKFKPKPKEIFTGAVLLLPAAIIAVALLLILRLMGLESNILLLVVAVLFGSWAVICGYYFPSKQFLQGGLVVLMVGVLVTLVQIVISIGSEPEEAAVIAAPEPELHIPESNSNYFDQKLEMAKRGSLDAVLFVADAYRRGSREYAVEQDLTEAAWWYERAANRRSALAQNALGEMTRRGAGVPQNHREAIDLFEKAAAQGYLQAQMNLAHAYAYGEGTFPNPVQAHMWYSIVESRMESQEAENIKFKGDPVASIAQLERTMRDHQILDSQRRMTNCVRSGFKRCD